MSALPFFGRPGFRRLPAVLAIALAITGCDGFPRDAAGTLDRVTGGVMRVGLLYAPPWADPAGPEPEGVEVALAEALAAELGAEIRWVTASETDVLGALKEREIDLVIGGLTEGNPWGGEVAFTRPYLVEHIVVASRGIDAPLPGLDEIPVAVDPSTLEPGYVAAKGGVPVPARGDAAPAEMEAKADWQMAPGETAVFVLHRDRHVVAVPNGENAWLIRVDRFFRGRGAAVHEALRAGHE